MEQDSQHEYVLEAYERHPLREETILARIAAARGTLEGLTEPDLAIDEATSITDQNHLGGMEFVRDLAIEAGIGAGSRVLDVGSGLGGSARALAYLFGCRVHGVELSPERCAEAVRLTARVGLADRVTFENADFLEIPRPEVPYDVVWGQCGWIHFEDKGALIRRAAAALKPGGRIAFEDSVLLREPARPAEVDEMAEVEEAWRSSLIPLATWRRHLEGQGLRTIVERDLTPRFLRDCQRLLETHAAGRVRFPEEEIRGWRCSLRLAESGLLGFARVVAG